MCKGVWHKFAMIAFHTIKTRIPLRAKLRADAPVKHTGAVVCGFGKNAAPDYNIPSEAILYAVRTSEPTGSRSPPAL